MTPGSRAAPPSSDAARDRPRGRAATRRVFERLDSLPRGPVPWRATRGGHVISQRAEQGAEIRDAHVESVATRSHEPPAREFDRLAAAVEALVERTLELRDENAALRRALGEREGQLLELNQRRQDALKRLDDLISQVDTLDARFESGD